MSDSTRPWVQCLAHDTHFSDEDTEAREAYPVSKPTSLGIQNVGSCVLVERRLLSWLGTCLEPRPCHCQIHTPVGTPLQTARVACPGRIPALFLSGCVNVGLCLSFLICKLWITITSTSEAVTSMKRVDIGQHMGQCISHTWER